MNMLARVGIAAVAAVGVYEIYKHTGPASRRAGVGDDVAVDPTKLNPPVVPPVAGASMVVRVTSADSQNVSGGIIGAFSAGQLVPFPSVGPAATTTVPRSAIVGIVKQSSGSTIAITP